MSHKGILKVLLILQRVEELEALGIYLNSRSMKKQKINRKLISDHRNLSAEFASPVSERHLAIMVLCGNLSRNGDLDFSYHGFDLADYLWEEGIKSLLFYSYCEYKISSRHKLSNEEDFPGIINNILDDNVFLTTEYIKRKDKAF
ncbi:MAG: hypothetical protein KA522_00700 [Candidatus Saccharicenans sp.]|jgi:hypothetical protein|nr:hypothetical protein [Candidatus Saccharicenans sp.]